MDSAVSGPSKWEHECSDEEDESLSEEQRKHKEEFRQWRKKHYNEFEAVKRARELIAHVSICFVCVCGWKGEEEGSLYR